MKNLRYSKFSPYTRELKPRLTLPRQALNIQNLFFSKDRKKETLIRIYPSLTTISSRELISMIEHKKDNVYVDNTACIMRDDILLAIQNFPCPSDDMEENNDFSGMDSNSSSSNELKRPANAFILYRTALSKKIKTLFPSFSNSDVSKFIGAMWKAASNEVKEKYISQAMKYRKQHKEKYPTFEYNIKKEPIDQTALTSDKIPALCDNWDNYFDWCFQTATATASQGKDDMANNSHPFPSQQGSQSNIDMHYKLNLGAPINTISKEWDQVCNIVTDFFPKDINQDILIDDKLWATLAGVDFFSELNETTSLS